MPPNRKIGKQMARKRWSLYQKWELENRRFTQGKKKQNSSILTAAVTKKPIERRMALC
jgi:hypothetical protein